MSVLPRPVEPGGPVVDAPERIAPPGVKYAPVLDRFDAPGLLSGQFGPRISDLEACMHSRRAFVTGSLAAAGATMLPQRAGAAPKSMTVVRESSFIKSFDDYFAKTLAA